jgi:hypothetical protein
MPPPLERLLIFSIEVIIFQQVFGCGPTTRTLKGTRARGKTLPATLRRLFFCCFICANKFIENDLKKG